MAKLKTGQQLEVGEKPAPSLKKKIIIVSVAALLVLLVAGLVTYILLGDETNDSGSAGQEQEELLTEPLYLALNPALLTTFNIDGRQRYLQVSFSVMSRDQDALDAVAYHMPLIRSKLNVVYSSSDFEALQTDAGKKILRNQTVQAINAVLKKEGERLIETIYFTNFVMQ